MSNVYEFIERRREDIHKMIQYSISLEDTSAREVERNLKFLE